MPLIRTVANTGTDEYVVVEFEVTEAEVEAKITNRIPLAQQYINNNKYTVVSPVFGTFMEAHTFHLHNLLEKANA